MHFLPQIIIIRRGFIINQNINLQITPYNAIQEFLITPTIVQEGRYKWELHDKWKQLHHFLNGKIITQATFKRIQENEFTHCCDFNGLILKTYEINP